MKTCIECGKPRDLGRRRCRSCSLSQKREYAKKRYQELGRYLYHNTCEACKMAYTSSQKHSRLCPSCLKESNSYPNATNTYEYEWTGDGYIWKHQRIVTNILQRKLNGSEVIHHVDENTQNNSLDNLWVMQRKYHGKLHSLLRIERVIFEKSKNENPVNCWNTLRTQITTTWLETASVNVIKISEIGQSASKPLSPNDKRKVQRLTAQDTLTSMDEGNDIVQTTTEKASES